MDQEKVNLTAVRVLKILQGLTEDERRKVIAAVTALYGSGA